jgi:predicted transcriptional regulator
MKSKTVGFGVRLTPDEHADLTLIADYFHVTRAKAFRKLIKQTASAIKIDINKMKEQCENKG